MVFKLDLPSKPWHVERQGVDFDMERWKLKRKWTTRCFVLECVMLGMDYSVTFLTLWLYIKTLLDTNYPKIFYSVISASYLLACVLVSMVVGRWIDSSRKIRKTFHICNILVIVGNIVYTLHFSPWLLVVGRLLSGFDGPLRSIISGEVARCYPEEEVLGKFSIMGMAFSLGFIMGPGVNFMFTTVDFTIGYWHVTYVNVPGLYMAALFIITEIVVYFTISDLSREFDLKKATYEITPAIKPRSDSTTAEDKIRSTSLFEHSLTRSNKMALSGSINYGSVDVSIPENEPTIMEASTRRRAQSIGTKKFERSGLFTQSFQASDCFSTASMILLYRSQRENEEEPLIECDDEEMSVAEVSWKLCSNIDTALVMILTFCLWYWMVAFDMWLPLMVVDIMGMGINELNGIVFGFGFISAIILFIISNKTFSDSTIYSFSVISMIALALMEGIFIFFKFYYKIHLALNVVLWITWGTLFAIVVVMDEVFLVGALAKMVSSNVQTFSESCRLSMSRFGALIALLTSAILFQWLVYTCLAAVAFSVLAVALLLWRRKTLSSPKVVIH